MHEDTQERHLQIPLPKSHLARGIPRPPRLITRGYDNGTTPDSPTQDSLASPLGSGPKRKTSRATLYKSTSSNSPLYMIKSHKVEITPLPFESADHDDEFENLTSTVLEKQTNSLPTVWKKFWMRFLYILLILSGVYFGLVGWPLWDGCILWFWRWYRGDIGHHHVTGLVAFLVAGLIRNILPQFLCTFDRVEPSRSAAGSRDLSECCVIIPCHKAADALRSTLPACLAIFKPRQIFVIANGNSSTPLDNTEEVCGEFGVRHAWLPVGSKITAEFVAVSLAREYKYCLLIDDDVLLPPNLHIATDAFDGPKNRNVACVAYAIKSVGSNSSRGTLVQQAQDLEYKLAGLLKCFQSNYGSVVFPHGAIALWRRDILESLLRAHPGYSISEDWWLGHTARAAGYRIVMSSSIFVETETPPNLFPSLWVSKQSRAGYGEMSVVQQRFFRWSFFYVFRIWANTSYLVLSWRLGWRELITKLFVFGECYDTIAKLVSPIMLPITMVANWRMTCIIWFGVVGVNLLLAAWFNLIHLGLCRKNREKEQVAWTAFLVYVFLKFIMMFVSAAGIYWSIYQYALFFTRQHLRVTESVPAWRVIRANARGNLAGRPNGCMV